MNIDPVEALTAVSALALWPMVWWEGKLLLEDIFKRAASAGAIAWSEKWLEKHWTPNKRRSAFGLFMLVSWGWSAAAVIASDTEWLDVLFVVISISLIMTAAWFSSMIWYQWMGPRGSVIAWSEKHWTVNKRVLVSSTFVLLAYVYFDAVWETIGEGSWLNFIFPLLLLAMIVFSAVSTRTDAVSGLARLARFNWVLGALLFFFIVVDELIYLYNFVR